MIEEILNSKWTSKSSKQTHK